MKLYRKKTLVEIVHRTQPLNDHEGLLIKNQGDSEDKWIIEKNLFESTYELVDSDSYVDRLKIECKELITKANKLHTFKSKKTFYDLDREDKNLLYEQSRVMDKYIQILGKRMERANINDFIQETKEDK